MSQTSVTAAPNPCFEGMVNTPAHENTVRSHPAASTVFPGTLAVSNAASEVVLGDISIKLVSAAGDVVAGRIMGVIIADVTKEATSAAYQEFVQYESVSVMRKGRVWVRSADAVDDLTKGVWVRHQNGAANPGAGLVNGSFRATTNADYTQLTVGFAWTAAVTIGSTYYGLLEVNLPT